LAQALHLVVLLATVLDLLLIIFYKEDIINHDHLLGINIQSAVLAILKKLMIRDVPRAKNQITGKVLGLPQKMNATKK
jgi:hypothetical protein